MLTANFAWPKVATTCAIGSHGVRRSARTYTAEGFLKRWRISAPSRWMFTALSFRNVFPSRVIEITGRSCTFSLTGFTLGTSTSSPNSMTCAVSIKMINSTKTTSTSGTTLMSASELVPRNRPRRPPLYEPPIEKAMLALQAPLGEVEEFEQELLHARASLLDAAAEYVVEHRCRNRCRQAQRCRDQSFRN